MEDCEKNDDKENGRGLGNPDLSPFQKAVQERGFFNKTGSLFFFLLFFFLFFFSLVMQWVLVVGQRCRTCSPSTNHRSALLLGVFSSANPGAAYES